MHISNFTRIFKRTAIYKIVAGFGLTAVLVAGQGCSLLECDNYTSYGDILDTWVGSELSEYESRQDSRPDSVMERPGNRLEYSFDTPYYDYSGNYYRCKTHMEVDRNSGLIKSYSYDGDCYMHGRCTS